MITTGVAPSPSRSSKKRPSTSRMLVVSKNFPQTVW
jgi:hypothetical protein